MRIIGNIEHPELKITVFKMDDRVTVKFENQAYEIGIKLGSNDQLNTMESISTWADQSLVKALQQVMNQLHLHRLEADNRAFPAGLISEFEDII
ncbi:MAG: hypothetical protein H6574_04435 [Lewinellaceae bacterium]|nr:hypothetical protein [Saprospiraceae bacterium]MCB9316412.1 hypothetical protein [Lewinellaceae bacterium]MCB9330309.1 hypothetical protein [Lewinellaceae bacterium]